ncbi:hypothetical protein HKX48_009554 [Thoreauomyces humboldtii]|nr:hypothetical protein HKX48_009554 [Thoreauomyces humboldtii]
MSLNPFVVEDENPFASTNSVAAPANPWGNGAGPTQAANRNWGNSQSNSNDPPIVTPSPAATHGRSNTGSSSITPAALANRYKQDPHAGITAVGSSSGPAGTANREVELQRREADVAIREARLKDRERAVGTFDKPNWPSCYPLVYHDIEKEIPVRGRWLVKRVYLGWMLAVLVYFVNCIAAFCLLVTNASSGGVTFGVSLLILLVGTPVSFVFWYRPLYKAVRADSSAGFFFFWFNYGCHLAVAVLLAVGIPGWGGVGIILTLAQFKNNTGVAVIGCISSALLIFEVFYGTWQIKSASAYFRSRGMSAEQAQTEAVVGFTSSKAGRDLAGTAVKTAVANEVRRT